MKILTFPTISFNKIAKIGNYLKKLTLELTVDPEHIAESLTGNTSLEFLEISLKDVNNFHEKCEKMLEKILALPNLKEVKIGGIPRNEIVLFENFLENSHASKVTLCLQIQKKIGDDPGYQNQSSKTFEILEKSTKISYLKLLCFQFGKISQEQLCKTFACNKTLHSLSLHDPDFIGISCDDLFGAFHLAENLRSISITFGTVFPTENSIDIFCDLINKNQIEEFDIQFENFTSKMTIKILTAVKHNTSITHVSITTPIEPASEALDALCEILEKNKTLTKLKIGPYFTHAKMTLEVATKIKHCISSNTTLKGITLTHVDVPCNFFWDLLPKNILTSAAIELGQITHIHLDDFEPLFWNYSLVNSNLQFSKQSFDAICVHTETNKGKRIIDKEC